MVHLLGGVDHWWNVECRRAVAVGCSGRSACAREVSRRTHWKSEEGPSNDPGMN